MRNEIRNPGLVIGLAILVAAAVCLGMAQETPSPATKEKHVKDIIAEQPQEAQSASPLCQVTIELKRKSPDSFNAHLFKVDPATLEPDLDSLMEKSDEVVLVGFSTFYTVAIAPSGKDDAEYFDVTVLRSWKGSHKVGDTLTFAMPGADLNCLTASIPKLRWVTFSTYIKDGWSGTGVLGSVRVLFLRRTHGDETPFLPGLRLTGGGGMQGMYSVRFDPYDHTCQSYDTKGIKTCMDFLESSQMPVNFQQYLHDPLIEKYDRMPLSSFLQEVQSVADSLGYTSQASVSK